MKVFLDKIKKSVILAVSPAKKTTLWILKIIIPVSLIVSILQYFGIIAYIASYLTPVFYYIGLPGESAIIFITSIFLPLYAPIAISTTLSFGVREMIILTVMCLISHNMLVETAIQKKAGSNYFVMFITRILSSFFAAFILNKILPHHFDGAIAASSAVHFENLWQMLQLWAVNSLWLIIKIGLIITGLIFLQNILKEFNLMDKIAKVFSSLMGVMGLSKNSTFLWLVAQLLGLTYGSAVMINTIETKEVSHTEADLLNFHIAVNHSSLEDTLLFATIGVPAGWMIFTRFVLAIFIVWFVRLAYFLFKKIKNTPLAQETF